MTADHSYYAKPGLMTGLGDHQHLLAAAPANLPALCRMVQGLLIHIFWAERYGLQLSKARKDEVQLRSVADKLDRLLKLDPQPLTEPRSLDKRLVGNCRDFSLLLTALLRLQAVPARARCGFAAYFLPDHYEDHWVCEYWDAARARWTLADAQLDEFQCDALKIAFDPLDVPRDQFIVGGKAWQLCRANQADPDTFGIFDMHGLWFVRGNFVRDVASLNKVELLPWDSWGLIETADKDVSPDDLDALDHMADLTCGDVPEWETVRAAYEHDERWRVPPTIRSYTENGVRTVCLAAA